ncbi:hypothetical protein IFM89_009700 [Coptis chinensis]|uniref:RNase H type-1 domain-containing protein n=1 Tax=Coptis chinensis TaxID=261450 RepID=A0A835LQV7_9MAGN|nr:hypothetical protein IFM89_009700 [Coptis chinensis]
MEPPHQAFVELNIVAAMVTIWKQRNRMTFDDKVPDLNQRKDMVQFQVEVTSRLSKGPSNRNTHDISILSFWNLSLRPRQAPKIKSCTWVPPVNNIINANTDGAACGNHGPSGIGATFKNSQK